MIKTFITSMKLNNVYRTNKTINSIKKYTRIGSDISNDWYTNKGMKIFMCVLGILKEFIELIGGKFLLLVILFLVMQSGLNIYLQGENLFFHIFLFMSIIECFARF